MLDLLVARFSTAGEDFKSRAYILTGDEWREAIALLTVPILFGWDAHLLYKSGAALIDISHHGQIVASFGAGNERDSDQLKAWC